MVTFVDLKTKKEKVCIVGLGYVGLPLAAIFSKHFSVIGFDTNAGRIAALKNGQDKNNQLAHEALAGSGIEFTSDPTAIAQAKFIIVAVPTPVDANKQPDLRLVEAASKTVGEQLSAGSVVVYESTVYPGVMEEICLPLLARVSGKKAGADFTIGYSPERINPGDMEHTIERVVKIVSGQDAATLDLVAAVYGTVTTVYRAASMKVAEAAKAIENTQRDLNVALVNELAVIFHKLGIDTKEVLDAAGTKWNFLKFYPGLVGGHCIGVDPYYLTYKAEAVGYHPEVILAGRRINDGMGAWIVGELMKHAAQAGKPIREMRVLICGITFKENISDVRNSKVVDIYKEIMQYGVRPVVWDPLALPEEVQDEYGIALASPSENTTFDIIIVAVAHEAFRAMPPSRWQELLVGDKPLFVDLKGLFAPTAFAALGIDYWRL